MDNRAPIIPASDDALRNPNRSSHVHHYVLKGSGLSCYAECDVLPPWPKMDGLIPVPCGEKLAGDNGPIVGSRPKVLAAIEG